MRKQLAIFILLCTSAMAQFGSRTATGIITGNPKPATCNVGQVWSDNSANPAVPYFCSATNTWTAISTSASGAITGTIAANQIPKGTGANVIGASSITDDATNVTSTESFIAPVGAANDPSFSWTGFETVDGIYHPGAGAIGFTLGGTETHAFGAATSYIINNSAVHCFGAASDAGMSRDGAAAFDFGTCTAGNKSGTINATTANITGTSTLGTMTATTISAPTNYGTLAVAGNGLSSVQAAPVAVTIGSGTSIGATSLCSTTLCPAGDYDVAVFIDITTACSTTGSYIVWLGWTDDAGAKTGSSTNTFIPVNGLGVTQSTGSLALASTNNYAQGHHYVHTTGAATGGAGSINYGTTAGACGTGGPMVGKMYLTVTRIR